MLEEGNRERGDTPVKVSVVGPGKSGIWRRERIRINEQELDDVAFLTGSHDVIGTVCVCAPAAMDVSRHSFELKNE